MKILDVIAVPAAHYFHQEHHGISKIVKVALAALTAVVLTISIIGIPLLYRIAVEYSKLNKPNIPSNPILPPERTAPLQRRSIYPEPLIKAVGEEKFRSLPILDPTKVKEHHVEIRETLKYAYFAIAPEEMEFSVMKGDKDGRLFICYKYRAKNSTEVSVDVIYLRDPNNNFWYLNDGYASEQLVEETQKRQVLDDVDVKQMAATTLGFLKAVVAGTHHRYELAT